MITAESGRWTQRDTQVPLSQTWRQMRSGLEACESANRKAAVATPSRNLVIVSLRSAPAVSLGCAPRYQLQSDGLVPYLVMKARAYAAGPQLRLLPPARADNYTKSM